jgi:hypothetical protein
LASSRLPARWDCRIILTQKKTSDTIAVRPRSEQLSLEPKYRAKKTLLRLIFALKIFPSHSRQTLCPGDTGKRQKALGLLATGEARPVQGGVPSNPLLKFIDPFRAWMRFKRFYRIELRMRVRPHAKSGWQDATLYVRQDA